MSAPILSTTTPTARADGSRLWVYPREFPGRYRSIHRVTSAALHAFLFVVPWVTFDGARALHIDVPARQVWVLGHLFTASDGLMLMFLGLFAAFALFFFTSLFGRLWCGYACPHSVFLLNWVLPIEEAIEGNFRRRAARDAAGWSFDRAWRKGAKWSLLLLVSFAVSMAFMGFFADPWALWTGRSGTTTYAVVLAFTGAWFFDLAWFREQLCSYLCPYARFQGALMDDHSLVIAYDLAAGEPRAKGAAALAAGRCMDCSMCVQACPMGIDIRDGFQLECIACGRCADACVAAHAKHGSRPLVGYTTLAEVEGRPRRSVRVRTVAYAALLTAIAAAAIGFVAFRAPFQATVNRAPGTLFQVDDDGYVRNTYLLRVTNTSPAEEAFTVGVVGLDHAEVNVAPVVLASAETRQVPLVVRVKDDGALARTSAIRVEVRDGSGDAVVLPSTFKTPGVN